MNALGSAVPITEWDRISADSRYEVEHLLEVLEEVKAGDFQVRFEYRQNGILGRVGELLNAIRDSGSVSPSSSNSCMRTEDRSRPPSPQETYAAPRAPSEPPARPGDETLRLDGLEILVVDDEDDARSLLTDVLSERGAHVAEAPSANAGFQELERFRPDIVVSDIAMPGGDGYGLIRAVRKLPVDRGGRTPDRADGACPRIGRRARLRSGLSTVRVEARRSRAPDFDGRQPLRHLLRASRRTG